MKLTATFDDGREVTLEHLQVSDGDLIRVSHDTTHAELERLIDHTRGRRVMFLVGDDVHVLGTEERLALARQIIQREGRS